MPESLDSKSQEDVINFTVQVTVKISEEEHEILRLICFEDNITPPEIVRETMEKTLREILIANFQKYILDKYLGSDKGRY